MIDAYEDINALNQKLDALIAFLQEKKIIPKPKEEKEGKAK